MTFSHLTISSLPFLTTLRYDSKMEALIEFVFIDKETSVEEVRKMGMDLADVLVTSNLAGTKSEARRHITSGAVRLDDRVVEDPFARLMIRDNHFIIVQKPIEPTDPVV